MSLPVPLAVRLSTSRGDQHVTRLLRDLVFREADPGGFTSAELPLAAPLLFQPDYVEPFGRVYVYDRQSGRTVWEGQLEDPSRTAGDGGEVWTLKAIGPAGHAQDLTRPLIYIDQPLQNLERVDNGTPAGSNSTGTDPGFLASQEQALILKFPSGTALPTNSRVVMRYTGLQATGQRLARLDHTWDAGKSDVNLRVQAVTRTDGSLSGGENARDEAWNTAGAGSAPRVIVTHFPAVGRSTVEWRILYTGVGGTVTDDLHWASISNMVVMATRYDKGGTELLTAASYTTNTVLASQVVEDLLGRLLPLFDGANAVVDLTAFPIDKLAWPDGTTAAGVLNELMALEPGFSWQARESTASGKWSFRWKARPTQVRYEAVTRWGFDAPGSTSALYNRARVRYRDRYGAIKTYQATAAVPALDNAGIVREGFVDLGDEAGSASNATQAGASFLTEHGTPPNAGTLTVPVPIYDHERGRMVQPWEIEAGALIRVRGVAPRIDALNPTDRDGSTVFRIASKEFTASTGAAVLDLDSYSLSVSRALARVISQARRGPRRR